MMSAHPVDGFEEQEVIISIGPDGRLFFHDLDAELIELALAINPGDALMCRRRELCSRLRENASQAVIRLT